MSINAPNKSNPWLFRFAVLTAFVTFLLIGLGGLVTSHEAGMSVPDWPNKLWLQHVRASHQILEWVGGIFYEHTHRLLASAVGFADDDSRRLALAERFAPMDALAGRGRVSGVWSPGNSRRPARDAGTWIQSRHFSRDAWRKLFLSSSAPSHCSPAALWNELNAGAK